MIERIWFGQSWLYLFLLPLSWLYGVINMLRRGAYRCGLFSSWKAPVPVVVVGNLTAGGNGKTPVVIWLVEHLTRKGIKVGVVSRGYGGKSEHYPLLITTETSTQQGGDEPVLIYQRTGVPVAVAPKRSDAVKALLEQYQLDVVLTDDGLQHYALQRDLELAVVDGVRRFGNGWWLPAGPMRERAGRLASVDAVIVNGGVPQSGEIAMKLVADKAVNLLTGEQRSISLLGKTSNIVAMAGIGHPPRFFQTLEQLGATLSRRVSFADHQHYDESQLSSLVGNNDSLLMTEKDAVKCKAFARKNWWYLPVSAELSQPSAQTLLEDIASLINRNHVV